MPATEDIPIRSREHEQRLISQLTLKRNSVLLQLRAAEQSGETGKDLKESRQRLEQLACELERHLDAVGNAASQRSRRHASTAEARTRHKKRPAPAPPVMQRGGIAPASSAPDLAFSILSLNTISEPQPRHRLKKSLSLSGSKGFFAAMLATLKGSRSAGRLPSSRRRSRSHDYLDLAPLDQEQSMVSHAAVRAQQRRGNVHATNTRSHSAEPRHMLPPRAPRSRHDSGGTPKRPEHLFLQAQGTRSRGHFKREPSPLARRPLTPHERTLKPPTPEYKVQGVSEGALSEIKAFEQLIEKYFMQNSGR